MDTFMQILHNNWVLVLVIALAWVIITRIELWRRNKL